jgi:putative endonuclease
MWYVYILKCADKTFYTGITVDLKRRVAEHNNSIKGARYTSTRRPVKLVYECGQDNRVCAMKEELRIKKLPRLKKIKIIKEYKK